MLLALLSAYSLTFFPFVAVGNHLHNMTTPQTHCRANSDCLGNLPLMAEQAGLEPTHRIPSMNGLAIRCSTCYAYCSVLPLLRSEAHRFVHCQQVALSFPHHRRCRLHRPGGDKWYLIAVVVCRHNIGYWCLYVECHPTLMMPSQDGVKVYLMLPWLCSPHPALWDTLPHQ